MEPEPHLLIAVEFPRNSCSAPLVTRQALENICNHRRIASHGPLPLCSPVNLSFTIQISSMVPNLLKLSRNSSSVFVLLQMMKSLDIGGSSSCSSLLFTDAILLIVYCWSQIQNPLLDSDSTAQNDDDVAENTCRSLSFHCNIRFLLATK